MKPKKREIFLTLGLVLLLGLWAFFPKQAGAAAVVSVDGKVQGTYDLSRDTRAEISGYGGFSLTLAVENGRAFVEDSTCPDLICQHHAAISDSGEQIVCLPGRVVIEISKNTEEGEIDAVVG